MQLIALPAPIVLVSVWDDRPPIRPVREQLPVQLLFVFNKSVLVPFQPGHPSHESKKPSPIGVLVSIAIRQAAKLTHVRATLNQNDKMPHNHAPSRIQLQDNQSVTCRECTEQCFQSRPFGL